MSDYAIIGVVGASRKPLASAQLHGLAGQVATAIVAARHAVLTGGHHLALGTAGTDVKAGAIRAVLAKATAGEVVRLMGIVPGPTSRRLPSPITTISIEPSAGHVHRPSNVKYLYAHTQLESEKRDWITGEAADALIALVGGDGTVREVDAAIAAGREVVFLDSWTTLGGKLAKAPRVLLTAASPAAAVAAALAAIAWGTKAQKLEGSFPEGPPVAPALPAGFVSALPSLAAEWNARARSL